MYKVGDYVKANWEALPGIHRGDVLKIVLVGPFRHGDRLVLPNGGGFDVMHTEFDYLCAVVKFPEAYTAAHHDKLLPLTAFRG